MIMLLCCPFALFFPLKLNNRRMLFGMSVASSMTLYMNCAVKSGLMHSFRLSARFFLLLFFMVEGNLVTP